MNLLSRLALCLVLLIFCRSIACCQLTPVAPYVDPSQLSRMPMPKHSFYLQPWRATFDTKASFDFLQGLGVNYNRTVPATHDELAIRTLAACGVHTARYEVAWNLMAWDASGLKPAEETLLRKRLGLFALYGIRPTLLLNMNQGGPCPSIDKWNSFTVATNVGDRTCTLKDVAYITPGYTGLNIDRMAGVLILSFDPTTHVCQLSKPLPKAFAANSQILTSTLRYLPVWPTGTPQWKETSDGFTAYAMAVCKVAKECVPYWDLEIYNELSSGGYYIKANIYYDPVPFTDEVLPQGDFLWPGGRCWELSNQAIQAVRSAYPQCRIVWGWSNTTFGHTPIEKLPAGTAAQSYHPYGVGTKNYPAQEDRPADNLEGYHPTMTWRQAEGWALGGVKTETIMRFLDQVGRKRHPPEVTTFRHYMTEHGVFPPDCQVTDVPGSWALKTRSLLRSFPEWLGKGITVVDWFCALDRSDSGDRSMGLLPSNLSTYPTDGSVAVSSQPLDAMRRMASLFADSVPIVTPTTLTPTVYCIGTGRVDFKGDATHPDAMMRDRFWLQPFQSTSKKFVIGFCEMTADILSAPYDQSYQVTLDGLPGLVYQASIYDPLTDISVPYPIQATPGSPPVKTFSLAATNTPRFLVIDLR